MDWKWWYAIWSWKVPLRIAIFCCLALENHLLSWDNLSKCGMIGPSILLVCGMVDESIYHLFVTCPFSISV